MTEKTEDMKWDETIESWGFTCVNDYAERFFKVHDGREISIMAFEDDEFEVAWVDENGKFREHGIDGMDDLKEFVDDLSS